MKTTRKEEGKKKKNKYLLTDLGEEGMSGQRLRKENSVFEATFFGGCWPIPKGMLKAGVGLGSEGAGEELNTGNKVEQNRLALTRAALSLETSQSLKQH